MEGSSVVSFVVGSLSPPLSLEACVKSDSDECSIFPKVEHFSTLSDQKCTQCLVMLLECKYTALPFPFLWSPTLQSSTFGVIKLLSFI